MSEQVREEEEVDGGGEDTTLLGYWSNPEAEVNYMCVGRVGMSQKSSTHRPSSQGWAPCVLLFCCLFVRFMGWGTGFLSPPFCLFASVL